MPKINILIVEDERIIAEVIAKMVNKMGYSVIGIENKGKNAVRTALKKRPDLILMDIELKDELDGIEAAKIIKSKIDVPVIYITAFMNSNRKRKAKLTKPCEYIIKPFDNTELEKCIKKILKLK